MDRGTIRPASGLVVRGGDRGRHGVPWALPGH